MDSPPTHSVRRRPLSASMTEIDCMDSPPTHSVRRRDCTAMRSGRTSIRKQAVCCLLPMLHLRTVQSAALQLYSVSVSPPHTARSDTPPSCPTNTCSSTKLPAE